MAAHREQARQDPRSFETELAKLETELTKLETELKQESEAECRGFRQAIIDTDGLAVISEVKRRSPSKGLLKESLDPVRLAEQYEVGGATCLSVLTDAEFFGGSAEDLVEARSATSLPVIRKDFTVCALDIVDARRMGADAILLIVAALDDQELADLHRLAIDLGLDALLETHDEAEVERALAIGANLIGVNQRDLLTFEVDTDRALRVGSCLPEGVVRVAESGVGGPQDAKRLFEAGYDAVLVGESLVKSADPSEAVREMRSLSC